LNGFKKIRAERVALVKKRFAEIEIETGLTREKIIEYALEEKEDSRLEITDGDAYRLYKDIDIENLKNLIKPERVRAISP